MHAEAGAVDDQREVEGLELVERLGGGAELIGQGLGFGHGAVEDRDAGTFGGEARDRGPRGATGAKHGDFFAAEILAQLVAGGTQDRGVVGVAGVQRAVGALVQRVGGADRRGQWLDLAALFFDKAQQVLFVRDRDAGAAEVQRRVVQPADDGGFEVLVFRRNRHRQVDAVVTGGGEAGVVERRRGAVAHGPADDAVDLGLGGLRVPAVKVFQLVERGLARSRRRVGVEGGEGEVGAKLLGQHARGQAGLAHAQGDGGFEPAGDEFEGVDVVAQRARAPRGLDDAAGGRVGHVQHAAVQVGGKGVKIVGREDQPCGHVGPRLVGVVHHQADLLADVGGLFVGRKLKVEVGGRHPVGAQPGVFQQAHPVGFFEVAVAAFPGRSGGHQARQGAGGNQLLHRGGVGKGVDAVLDHVGPVLGRPGRPGVGGRGVVNGDGHGDQRHGGQGSGKTVDAGLRRHGFELRCVGAAGCGRDPSKAGATRRGGCCEGGVSVLV